MWLECRELKDHDVHMRHGGSKVILDLEDHGKNFGLHHKLSRKQMDYFSEEVGVWSDEVMFMIFR